MDWCCVTLVCENLWQSAYNWSPLPSFGYSCASKCGAAAFLLLQVALRGSTFCFGTWECLDIIWASSKLGQCPKLISLNSFGTFICQGLWTAIHKYLQFVNELQSKDYSKLISVLRWGRDKGFGASRGKNTRGLWNFETRADAPGMALPV